MISEVIEMKGLFRLCFSKNLCQIEMKWSGLVEKFFVIKSLKLSE